ncbi:MAG: LamG domain-containing protein [Bacteroidota bacterium]
MNTKLMTILLLLFSLRVSCQVLVIPPITTTESGSTITPLAEYRMEGDATDETGNYDGTLINGLGFTSDYSPPVGTQSINQNGSDRELRTPTMDVTQSGSWEAWVRPTGSGTHVVVSNYQTGTGSGATMFLNMASNLVEFWSRSSSTNNSATSTTGHLIANDWNHVVCVWNAGTAAIYINGVDRTSGDNTCRSDWTTNQVIDIGVWPDGSYDAYAQIAFARIFDIDLTSINAAYAYSHPGLPIPQ